MAKCKKRNESFKDFDHLNYKTSIKVCFRKKTGIFMQIQESTSLSSQSWLSDGQVFPLNMLQHIANTCSTLCHVVARAVHYHQNLRYWPVRTFHSSDSETCALYQDLSLNKSLLCTSRLLCRCVQVVAKFAAMPSIFHRLLSVILSGSTIASGTPII